MRTGTRVGLKKASVGSPGAEVKGGFKLLNRTLLGTDLWSSERTASALNCWAIALALAFKIFNNEVTIFILQSPSNLWLWY